MPYVRNKGKIYISNLFYLKLWIAYVNFIVISYCVQSGDG